MTSRIPSSLPAPAPITPTPAPRFPWVATVAPVIAAVVLWLVTSSAFALLFAALGPVAAVAALIDGRLAARRALRQESQRFDADLAMVRERVLSVHEQHRRSLQAQMPGAVRIVARGAPAHPGLLSLGVGSIPHDVVITGAETATDAGLVELVALAATLTDAPIECSARAHIAVVAPPTVGRAIVRSLRVQVDASSAASERADGERPTIDRVGSSREVAAEAEVVVIVASGRVVVQRHPRLELRGAALTLELVSQVAADVWRQSTARPSGPELAPRVELAPLLDTTAMPAMRRPTRTSLACTPAVDALGVVTLDLVEDGPHAIVGGTTGSGKSEVLISWVLAIAAAHPPDVVTFLFIDFKGGATFAALEPLPHTVGIITDLDRGGAQRAFDSLAAEVRFREAALADAGVRSIEHSELPRLVIVVDEFAAMLDQHGDLAAVFADLAARGRSIGIHLILATQRPAGVMSPAVLANADVRISLRVNNPADSTAVVGVADASAIAAEYRGRAVLRTAARAPQLVQFALAGPDDRERVSQRFPRPASVRRPWCAPLPSTVILADLPPHPSEGVRFGLVDEPERQRQTTAVWDARTGLLVQGAPGSGLTTTLVTLSAAARELGIPSTWIAARPDRAWDQLVELVKFLDERTIAQRELVLLDDLDALLARFTGEHRSEVVDALTRLCRDGPERGLAVVASAQRVVGDLTAIASALPERVLLRHAHRHDYVLAGGEGRDFDVALPPGRGSWRGHRVHVAVTTQSRPADLPCRVTALDPRRPLAIVSAIPAWLAPRLGGEVGGQHGGQERGEADGHEGEPAITHTSEPGPRRVRWLDGFAADDVMHPGDVVVGDSDTWQARWGLLASLRPTVDIVLHGLSLAEVRVLTRSRRVPPPLAPDRDLAWRWLANGEFDRVRLTA